jgi:hypothetical protein
MRERKVARASDKNVGLTLWGDRKPNLTLAWEAHAQLLHPSYRRAL